MADRGCFGDEAGRRRADLAAGDMFLLPAEIDGLRGRLRGIVRAGTSKTQSVTPVSLSKACFGGDPSIVDLLCAVLDGKVVAVGWREPLLGGLLMAAEDVAALRSTRDRQASG